jgi:hypothetical protein
MPPDAWPDDGEIVERVPLRSCARRGAAIDIVADRARENRSQLVFTTGRGREMVFWQSPRTKKQARPNVALPTARARGLCRRPDDPADGLPPDLPGGRYLVVNKDPTPPPAPGGGFLRWVYRDCGTTRPRTCRVSLRLAAGAMLRTLAARRTDA